MELDSYRHGQVAESTGVWLAICSGLSRMWTMAGTRFKSIMVTQANIRWSAFSGVEGKIPPRVGRSFAALLYN